MDYTALRIGTTLHNGTYEIKKVLGQGGFGITYLAYDNGLGKYVAIKEFFPSTLCGRDGNTDHITVGTLGGQEMVEDLKAKFIKEAQNIAKLNHPDIIRIFFTFQENNTAYYVMEYIEGMSLSDIVKQRGALPVAEATDYINRIGEALEYLHSCHMTHLDVKPANIMIRYSDNLPILIDFGLSKNYDQEGRPTTTTNTMGLSPGYSPTEQYVMTASNGFSPRSDLYSLAATYYNILTAQQPAEAPMNIAANMYFPDNVPPHIRQAIITAMASSPEGRHPSVRAFLDHINNPMASQPHYASAGQGAPHTVLNSQHPQNAYPYAAQNGGKYMGVGNQKDSGSNVKWIALGAAGVAIVILAAVGFFFFKTDNNVERESVEEAVVTDSAMEPAKDIAAEKPAPEPVKELSPYGPFENKNQLKTFLNDYYSSEGSGSLNPRFIADNIETNFGTPHRFTRSKYLEEDRKYKSKQNYLYSSRDIDWNTLQTTPTQDGGLKVKFTQIYYMTCDRDGLNYTRQFRLNTEITINDLEQISKIKETTKKLDEWYD